MLYDPKWGKTKVDPLTLEAFVAWLEKQPEGKPYCYTDTGHCLAAQYNQSIGRDYLKYQPSVSYEEMNNNLRGVECFNKQIEMIAVGAVDLCGQHSQWQGSTFGHALQRAREYQRILAD